MEAKKVLKYNKYISLDLVNLDSSLSSSVNQTTTATITSNNNESSSEHNSKKQKPKKDAGKSNKNLACPNINKINDKTQYYNNIPVIPAKYSDSDDSEDEGMEDYKVGGYHPIHVG